MLSRLADSLFWTGRYVERAENVARFIGVNLNLILDTPLNDQQQWQPLVVTSGDYQDFELRYGEPTRDNCHPVPSCSTPDNRNSILLQHPESPGKTPAPCGRSFPPKCGSN